MTTPCVKPLESRVLLAVVTVVGTRRSDTIVVRAHAGDATKFDQVELRRVPGVRPHHDRVAPARPDHGHDGEQDARLERLDAGGSHVSPYRPARDLASNTGVGRKNASSPCLDQ